MSSLCHDIKIVSFIYHIHHGIIFYVTISHMSPVLCVQHYSGYITKSQLEGDNLLITTTDNGSNFVAAIHIMACFGHNLDLDINKALNVSRVQR